MMDWSHAGRLGNVLTINSHDLIDVPVVAGGIIPEADAETLRAQGIAPVYTPKDFELDNIMSDLIDLVDRQHAAE